MLILSEKEILVVFPNLGANAGGNDWHEVETTFKDAGQAKLCFAFNDFKIGFFLLFQMTRTDHLSELLNDRVVTSA